jgi:hypothetical protein
MEYCDEVREVGCGVGVVVFDIDHTVACTYGCVHT